MDHLSASMKVAASGLDAQSLRLRVVSENLANAQSTSDIPGGDPYQRKLVSFKTILADQLQTSMVDVHSVSNDPRAFSLEFDPGSPGANEQGYVKMPNVNSIIEMADMREANRSYQANLQVFKQARELISLTIDLMRAG
jgi:flagellar basal-body rod protein FlgC